MTITLADADVLERLADIRPDSSLAAARRLRDAASRAIQESYRVLTDADDGIDFPRSERLEVARQVALWHGDSRLADFYALLPAQKTPTDSARLEAALVHAQRVSHHPIGAAPGHLHALEAIGWSLDAIVTLSQIIAFVSFQSRLLRGFRLINTQPVDEPSDKDTPAGRWRSAGLTAGGRPAPQAFTQDELGWEPWIEPKKRTDFHERQRLFLADNHQADEEYLRLLARNFAAFEQGTLLHKAIFYTPGGLPRHERELAATAASKVNGCIYGAGVHGRKAGLLSQQPDEIARLLDTPAGGALTAGGSPRGQAIIEFAAALSATPAAAGPRQLSRLRALGLREVELLDIVQASAFSAWDNRLMLTLGEPYAA